MSIHIKINVVTIFTIVLNLLVIFTHVGSFHTEHDSTLKLAKGCTLLLSIVAVAFSTTAYSFNKRPEISIRFNKIAICIYSILVGSDLAICFY